MSEIAVATPVERTTQPVPVRTLERRSDTMWPVEALRPLLPWNLQAFEDTDFVEIALHPLWLDCDVLCQRGSR